jgi:hypothetical protein
MGMLCKVPSRIALWFELDLADDRTEAPVVEHRAAFPVGVPNFRLDDNPEV